MDDSIGKEKSMGKYKTILYEKRDKIATLTLNRPEKMNALTDEMMAEIPAALEESDNDPDVRVTIVTGAGPHFCTGYDLEGGSSYADLKVSLQEAMTVARAIRKKYLDIMNSRKPTIAKIRGYCFAGGIYINMMCDVGIAAEDAVFGHTAVQSAGPTGNALFVWLLGPRKAKELLLTGRLITGKEAERIGLVNMAVPPERLDEEVELMARDMASIPLDSSVLTKESIQTALEVMGLYATFRTQSELNALGRYGEALLDINLLRGMTKEKLARLRPKKG